MIKLGKTMLNGAPRIVASLKDNLPAHLFQQAKDFGLDIVEHRIDQYASFQKEYVLDQISKWKDCPAIATIRSKKEGGEWVATESERLKLFEAIIPRVDAVDIELSSKEILPQVIKSAHDSKKVVIVSSHDFEKTPDVKSLEKILLEARSVGADIVKIATMILKNEDLQILAAFTIAHTDQNIITIGMGEKGVVSRVFFPSLGSLMTYACLGEPTAPGQLSYRQTFDYLRAFYPSFK